MKKQVALVCLFSMLLQQIMFLCPTPVMALTSSELEGRNACGEQVFELAYANTDGSLTTKACYQDYAAAKQNMDNNQEANHENLVILKRDASVTRVFDAKYAIVDLDKGNAGQNTNILETDITNNMSTYTYINGAPRYGAGDAAYLGINPDNRRVKIRIGGVTGWIAEIEAGYRSYKIVPLAWVKSTTKYVVTNDSISHHTTGNIYQTQGNNTITIGPKPTMLASGTYYSYDGNYFYSDLRSMLDDYRGGTVNRSVNKDVPYYNYYQYLPHHTKSTYSGTDIDNYLNNRYETILKYNYTMLYGQGYAFYNAQENSGINAMLMLSVAQNESAQGRSGYATARNNLFGHNAVDSNPDSATLYPSVREGIMTHANTYFNYGYAFPSNWKFYGSHLGNKLMGANVKYASDPYWGEKAAANYYQMDASMGFQDYNYYQVAVKSRAGTIYPASEPRLGEQYRISTKTATVSEPYYNYGRLGSPVTIVGEVQGDVVEGNSTWYKIISDVNIDANNKFVENKGTKTKYDWTTNYVYVPASYYTKINNNEIKDVDQVTDYPEKKYTYETYSTGGMPTPQVAIINKNKTALYNNPTLETASGRTWNQGDYVVVFEKAYDETGSLKSYQVSSTYKKGFREWTQPENLNFVLATYGKVRIYNGTYANVRSAPGGTLLNDKNSGLAEGTYVVIFEIKEVNGVTWLRINYDGQFGWVVAKDNDQEIMIGVTTVQNSPPVIEASNRTIPIKSTFNPLEGVVATDKEDGNITSRIQVESSNVNTTVAGTYQVTYIVTDNAGETTKKTVSVTVKDLEEKNSFTAFWSYRQTSGNNFEVSGFHAITGQDTSSTTKHYLVFVDMETGAEQRFAVDTWQTDYPYDMTNVDDDKNYNYSNGWFKGTIDLTSLPEGNYTVYTEVENGLYKGRKYFTNKSFKEMMRKAIGTNNRGYKLEINYSHAGSPMNLEIRNQGLLASSIPPTIDNMYNRFYTLSLGGNYLDIVGSSYNVGVDYGENQKVERSLVLEQLSTFKRKEYDVGFITNGPYQIELPVPDGKSKLKGWYNAHIDLTSLEKGVYVIYIKTTVGSFSDYGVLKDTAYKDLSTKTTLSNGNQVSVRRVDNKNFRIELIIT